MHGKKSISLVGSKAEVLLQCKHGKKDGGENEYGAQPVKPGGARAFRGLVFQ
jgi:hypothetical protein